MNPTRRRGLLLLCFALVCGGLAASQVRERERQAEAAVGPLVPVVVAKRELAADERLGGRDLAVRRMPARFAPPDALAAPGQLTGARTAVPIAAGGLVTAGMIAGPGTGRGPLRAGQRALELAVTGGGALAGAQPGARVDVLVSVEGEQGGGRTFVALEDVELLGLRAADGEELAAGDAEVATGSEGALGSAAGAPSALATLRVSARQAVYLAAAANFAQEVRLLVRPPGDRRRVGAAVVEESGL
jgi:pilus assembly protein CpaB